MSNKTIYISIVLILVLSLGGYFVWDNYFSPAPQEQEEEDSVTFKTFEKEEFEMQIPDFWVSMEAPEGIKAFLSNLNEEEKDGEKEGFRSYLAVTYDARGEKTMPEFLSYVKETLSGTLSDIEFEDQLETEIDGRKAQVSEAVIMQEGYQFNTLLVIIEGEGEDVWTLSFNTSKIKWNDSKDLFYQMAESFKLKGDEETAQE